MFFYKIKQKLNFRFDEMHYGKYVGQYLKRTFFFDANPPLGKLLIASAAYLANFDGTGGTSHIRSFYMRIGVYAIEKWPFSGTYPLIYSDCWSFNMQFHYIRAYFWSPYFSHITRSTSIHFL